MDSDDAYAQWERDTNTLAVLGRVLSEQPTRIRVTLPADLAESARAAWEREGYEGDLPIETCEQRQTRHRAGALGLIGLAVMVRGEATDQGIVVDIDAWEIGFALEAADEAGLLRDLVTRPPSAE